MKRFWLKTLSVVVCNWIRLNDHIRYENYDYPASITKPLPSYGLTTSSGPHHHHQQTTGVANGSGILNYRNLPLPRYHLETTTSATEMTTTTPKLFNGMTATTTVVDIHHHAGSGGGGIIQPDHSPANNLLGVIIDPVLYARHFAGHHDLRVYQDDQDRHNDSGYSTRPGESSQGPSPSLSGSNKNLFLFIFIIVEINNKTNIYFFLGFLILKKGPAESTEGDTTTMSPQSSRRMEHFQSHFARDLAQTLPAMTNGSSSVITTTNGYYHHHQNGNSNGVGVVAYPRVRFAVPEHEQSHFPPGTISSSSLV